MYVRDVSGRAFRTMRSMHTIAEELDDDDDDGGGGGGGGRRRRQAEGEAVAGVGDALGERANLRHKVFFCCYH